MRSTHFALLLFVALAGCTKRVDQCAADADCTDPAHPFCDVDGAYPASGGQKGVCTITPPDCPVARCGCTPGATTCGSGELTMCNADGMSVTMTNCALDCEADGTACKTFAPSNGLGPALTVAGTTAAVTFPSPIKIDTDTGVVTDGGGLPVTVTSIIVTQATGNIRAFVAQSFDITDATISGSAAVAFVAADTVTIHGDVAAHASYAIAGPGAVTASSPCVGTTAGNGGGGGGNATAGGNGTMGLGSGTLESGGAMESGFSPLIGGCDGGGDGSGADGGGGGGGMQIVAGASVTVTSVGVIDLGGGGGGISSGGGAGGNLVIESPIVSLDGIVAANGGSGGACTANGDNATANATAAPGIQGCSIDVGIVRYGTSGAGGTAMSAPGNGVYPGDYTGAAGGGAVGRMRVATGNGMYEHASGATLSVEITTATLEAQ